VNVDEWQHIVDSEKRGMPRYVLVHYTAQQPRLHFRRNTACLSARLLLTDLPIPSFVQAYHWAQAMLHELQAKGWIYNSAQSLPAMVVPQLTQAHARMNAHMIRSMQPEVLQLF
jgi:hypothetical protein